MQNIEEQMEGINKGNEKKHFRSERFFVEKKQKKEKIMNGLIEGRKLETEIAILYLLTLLCVCIHKQPFRHTYSIPFNIYSFNTCIQHISECVDNSPSVKIINN